MARLQLRALTIVGFVWWLSGPIPLAAQPVTDAVDGSINPAEVVGELGQGESSTRGASPSQDETNDSPVASDPVEGGGFDDGLDGEAPLDEPLVVLPEITRKGARHFLSSFKLPDKLEFAGHPVPLDEEWHVRERIEYEFYQFLAAEGESIIMAKRTGRCFPPVEKELAEAGLPDDLKYILLVESKCVAAAYSRARASGPWQFVRSTARRFKLKSNRWRDERRNLELSTEAAIKYLSHLKEVMGDWFLAMAAYNAGESRIRKRLKEQKVNDYWKFHYVRETMRYVPRVIAAKEIFSQPEKYIGLTTDDLYEPIETETVTIRVKKRKQHLASIAERYGTYYLELKMLNPELRRAYLPRGRYKLKVPKQDCPFRCFKQNSKR